MKIRFEDVEQSVEARRMARALESGDRGVFVTRGEKITTKPDELRASLRKFDTAVD